MKLSKITLNNFRNIEYASLVLSSGINVFFGENGAGKSSILEAIHHLSTGNSFKTRHFKKVIKHGASNFSVRGELSSQHSLAIQKQNDKSIIVKINNDNVNSSSALARHLPLQIIFEDLFNIIDCGPSERRKFLDWGVFHVEPSYYTILSKYKKAVMQRNTLLKKQIPDLSALESWDKLMINNGIELHALREKYMVQLIPQFISVLKALSPSLAINISYQHGWGQSLAELNASTLEKELLNARKRDIELGYSTKGAHRADLRFYSESHLAKEFLSRGQQKVALIALKLAQGMLLSNNCVYLIDDLSSELDAKTLERIGDFLKESKAQVIMTSLDGPNPILKGYTDRWFHVEKGRVEEVLI